MLEALETGAPVRVGAAASLDAHRPLRLALRLLLTYLQVPACRGSYAIILVGPTLQSVI